MLSFLYINNKKCIINLLMCSNHSKNNLAFLSEYKVLTKTQPQNEYNLCRQKFKGFIKVIRNN